MGWFAKKNCKLLLHDYFGHMVIFGQFQRQFKKQFITTSSFLNLTTKWKHAKVDTKISASNKILGSLKKE
jgi:hypothetical protein